MNQNTCTVYTDELSEANLYVNYSVTTLLLPHCYHNKEVYIIDEILNLTNKIFEFFFFVFFLCTISPPWDILQLGSLFYLLVNFQIQPMDLYVQVWIFKNPVIYLVTPLAPKAIIYRFDFRLLENTFKQTAYLWINNVHVHMK